MKNTYRLLFFLVATGLLFIGADIPQASAQSENGITGYENVQLWVYPEYDDPRLLVMLEGQIMGVKPPAEVRFLVPSASEMYSAGSMDAQGIYSGGPPQREPSQIPDWDEISYEVTTDTFRIEYYDPIIIGQSDKTISYEFRWLYPISNLAVIIQEPRGSSNFTVLPQGESFTDNQGFASHLYNHYDIDDELPLRFDITYFKSDPNPSLALEDNESTTTNVPMIAGIVTGSCVAFVIGYLRRKKSRPRTRAERRHSAQSTLVRGSKEKHSSRRFCSQCGQRLDSPSRFCPHCGTNLQ